MKVLIVDDEPLVRKGLVTMLEKLDNIDAVEEANNGEVAKQVIERFRPDIVFADIVMPKLDGIELLKWMMLNYPEIRSIVLSSHQDFHYVKQAFIFGALDYVLKYDINEDILRETIANAAAGRTGGGASRESKTEKLLFSGKGGEQYQQSGMMVLCLYAEDVELCVQKLRSYSGVFSHIIHMDRIYAIADREQAEEIAQAMAADCFVGVSEFGYPQQAVALRRQAELAVDKRFFTAERRIYRYTPILHELPEKIAALKKQVSQDIFAGSMAGMISALDELHNCVRETDQISVIAIKIMYTSIAEMLSVKYQKVFREDGLNLDEINKAIVEAQYLDEIRSLMESAMKTILNEYLQVLDTSNCSQLTKKVIDYINRNYGDGLLGLDVVAEKYGYTASYLSRMFKRDTGVNVVDYINEIRILAARKMLADGDKKVYEVAEEVGYNNYNHFSKTFKRISGITPTQYLENHKK